MATFDSSWGLWQWSQYVHSLHCEGPMGAQTVKVVRRNVWHVYKLLTSYASPGKVEAVCPDYWPIVANLHHFGG